MRYFYGGSRMWWLPTEVVTVSRRFEDHPSFISVLGTKRNVQEFVAHIEIHDRMLWERMRPSWRAWCEVILLWRVTRKSQNLVHISSGTIPDFAVFFAVPKRDAFYFALSASVRKVTQGVGRVTMTVTLTGSIYGNKSMPQKLRRPMEMTLLTQSICRVSRILLLSHRMRLTLP